MAVDQEVMECPLCMENLDIDDKTFFPCTCGYQICRFCWHRIRMNENGLCPACRKAYSENPANFKPLSAEELQKMKLQKRQKEQQKKQKNFDNRRHLADLRVVQKNLVFVVGLSSRIADAEILKRNEYFGKFGKIVKIVVNSCLQVSPGTTAGAYITYGKAEDALRSIQSVNNSQFDGKTIKASLGTTKYCSHFMRNQNCPKSECMYLHHYGDSEASFTKEDMQMGKHQEYEKKLIEEFVVQSQHQQQKKTVSKTESLEPPKNNWESIETPPPVTNISANELEEHDNFIQEIQNIVDREPVVVVDRVDRNMMDRVERMERVADRVDTMDRVVTAVTTAVKTVHSAPEVLDLEEDDDLGFDPFHETQKAFEELIQLEVSQNSRNSSLFFDNGPPSQPLRPPPGFTTYNNYPSTSKEPHSNQSDWMTLDPAIIYSSTQQQVLPKNNFPFFQNNGPFGNGHHPSAHNLHNNHNHHMQPPHHHHHHHHHQYFPASSSSPGLGVGGAQAPPGFQQINNLNGINHY